MSRKRRGSAGRWDAVATAGLTVSLAAAALLLYAGRRYSGRTRYDVRDEVVLEPTLVARVNRLAEAERPKEAFALLRTEARLGFEDTLLAMAMIREAAQSHAD